MTLKNLMDLIQKYIHDELDSKGMEELRLALEQTEHQEILGQILENQLKNRAFETEEELSAVFERLETKLDNYIHQKGNMPELQVSFKRKLYNRLMAAAAVLVFIFSVTAAYLLMHKGSRKNIEIAKYSGDVAPGHKGAVLHLSDGRIIVLDSAADGKLAMQGNIEVIKENGELKYKGKDGSVVYNDISTDRGRQWQLTLPDGSRVWLNAGSTIHYPLSFAGNERKVIMTGEAYFAVKHDSKVPFRVYINSATGSGGIVEDMGTEFNINSYSDETTVKTTLIAGSINVSKGESKIIAKKPGDQVYETGDKLKIGKADIEEVIAWRKGVFSFHHENLKTIMRQLSRWYNVEVKYETEIPENLTFTGDMGQDLSLQQILTGLKKMKINLKIEDNKRIIITP